MSKVTAAHIGIEQLTFHAHDEIDSPFPARFSLPPDGEAIPSHLNKLYELSPGDSTLKSLTQPKISDMSLLRPKQYQAVFAQAASKLTELAEQLDADDLRKAANAMKQTKVDQDYLTLAFNLLLRV
ncbi:YscX family type III secretion protein [Shewanella sp. SR44-3]|uniref:type III secretion apparatus assembly protein SctX n=1 Tax=unclassified Shewanella TaxID=196818 RepID=UPI0015FD50E3|nr:YscX family type III secretion protein [Shewanella sp. SR44-3]MBB1268985.1 YscX family type III secretion protein [Shewanella sp. SR44-3]